MGLSPALTYGMQVHGTIETEVDRLLRGELATYGLTHSGTQLRRAGVLVESPILDMVLAPLHRRRKQRWGAIFGEQSRQDMLNKLRSRCHEPSQEEGRMSRTCCCDVVAAQYHRLGMDGVHLQLDETHRSMSVTEHSPVMLKRLLRSEGVERLATDALTHSGTQLRGAGVLVESQSLTWCWHHYIPGTNMGCNVWRTEQARHAEQGEECMGGRCHEPSQEEGRLSRT